MGERSRERGVIYVATGVRYVALAERSARTLKRCNPNLPVHIFSDQDIDTGGFFDSATKISNPHRRSKVDYIYQTPFDQTIYLDADTRVLEDIQGMFALLEHYDLAATYSLGRGARKFAKTYSGPVPPIFAPISSAVVVFRKSDAVAAFFKDWQAAFHASGHRIDQTTFREALWRSDVRLMILPPEYNVREQSYLKVLAKHETTPKIMHLKRYKEEPGIPSRHPLGRRRRLWRLVYGLAWHLRVRAGVKPDV